jgi:UDP-N-acetyl-D-galactosamine dehydrogenase
VVLAVAHAAFAARDVRGFLKPGAVLYDVKAILPRDQVDGRL